MNMSTVQAVAAVCGMIAGVAAVLALVYKFCHWLDRQKAQDQELKDVKATHEADMNAQRQELTVICYALLACLDGLKQLGANGNVTEAHNALDKHLNKNAHK